MTPNKIGAKEFEELVLFRGRKESLLAINRYGTQTTFRPDPANDGNIIQTAMKSLPDFDLTLGPNGRHVIIEAKVCSQASYPLWHQTHTKNRQINHMMEHSQVNALCYLLIHFNRRELKTMTVEAVTYALPVHPDLPLWQDIGSVERKSIKPEICEMYGHLVEWNLYSERASKHSPDLLGFMAMDNLTRR